VLLLANELSLHYVFLTQLVWIDIVLVATFLVIHTVANWGSPNLGSDRDERQQSFGFVSGIASGGVTATGILLPLSLAALGIISNQTGSRSLSTLSNVFIANVWLTLSLLLGLFVLWMAGFRAPSQNVLNILPIRLAAGWQLGILFAGVARLLIAAFLLVESQALS
jgi:uncharacterized membrane protein